MVYRLQVVLVNRLVLNLNHAANAREDSDSELRTRTNLEPPTFAAGPFLGNIGGRVRSLSDEFYDDELEVEVEEGVFDDGDGLKSVRGDAAISVIERKIASSSNDIEEIIV